MVSWGGVSIDSEVDNNSDSGRGTDIIEKENKPNLDGGKTISVKVPVRVKGKVTVVEWIIAMVRRLVCQRRGRLDYQRLFEK